MKKIIISLVTVLLFCSCEQEYSCYCTLHDNTGKQVNSLTDRGTFTKSDAEAWCKGKEQAGGLGFTYKCTLN